MSAARVLTALGLAALAVLLAVGAGGASSGAVVERVIDGDTIVLRGGARVRLLQIDSPEVGTGECYSRAAAREARRLLPAGAAVRLEVDPRLDRVDRYGRLLRYVLAGGQNVNVELVARGAATPWFYGGKKGAHAAALLSAVASARAGKRGMWGACRVLWNPYGPVVTLPR
jgi:micrococcal nuclease